MQTVATGNSRGCKRQRLQTAVGEEKRREEKRRDGTGWDE
jgi:hypothetical protein